MSVADGDAFRVGLLGYGTVGAAFAELLPRHADRIERITGLRPELSGVLTRSRGSFDDILENSDLLVELIGGLEPAREYLLAAMRADAQRAGDIQRMQAWAGQSAALGCSRPAGEMAREIGESRF